MLGEEGDVVIEIQTRSPGSVETKIIQSSGHSRLDEADEWSRNATGFVGAAESVALPEATAWPPEGATPIDLDGRPPLHGMVVHRDAAAVVIHPDPAVGEQGDLDPVRETGQRLVDGVVDHFVDEMMEAALAGRADVHAGALAHRLKALKDGDRAGIVGRQEQAPPERVAQPGARRPPRRWRSGGALNILPGITLRLSRSRHVARVCREPAIGPAAAGGWAPAP